MRLRLYGWVAVSLGLALTGCTHGISTGPTSQPGGPAFEMTVLGAASCATAPCVRVKIRNLGETGDGRCRLRHTATSSPGGAERDVWGQWIELSGIAHGAAVVKVTAWDPSVDAVGYCEPGLHS